MEIILTANTYLEIQDLGVILQKADAINLLENFEIDDLLNSNDLETQNNNYIITIDSENVSYDIFIERIISLTKHEHNKLNVLQHNLYEQNYFMVIKEGGKSKFITYYKDNTQNEKIQEDEIVRDAEGKVSQIITRKYDSGLLHQEMIQILNRGNEGKVESISTNTL